MTTDLVKKEYAVETEIGGKTVYIGGIAKGSGMIHPNMATMLCFITTDAAISADMLKIAVKTVADKSFNMVSVDGDTSTNDTLAVMASGLAGNAEITEQNEDYNIFVEALTILCRKLSKEMAKDGEGASKLLVCKVSGAKTEKDAKGVAGRPERHFADVEDVAQRVAVVIDAPGQFPVIFVAPAAHADFLGEGLSQAAGSVVVVQFDVKCGGADSDDHGFLSSGFGFAARAGKMDRPA